MIHEDIKNFSKQFSYKPEIKNGKPGDFRKFIVVGMGGSGLATDLVKILRPDLDIVIHRDYGLPDYLREETLVVLSSYSGNTEEVVDAYKEAGKRNLKRLAIGADGELLKLAESDGVPYIKFPESKIQPRVALGFSFLALLKAVGDERLLKESADLTKALEPKIQKEEGRKLAGKLKDSVPVIYTSNRNKGLSYAWKIVLDETGKIPAFANVLPELNHTEMTGFDIQKSTEPLSKNFFFLFLRDNGDNPRILKRMEVLRDLYQKRGFRVETLELQGSPLLKIFSSFILANWTAYYLAEAYGVESEEVPMVEEFKKLIK
jgi:glucose/mannose-6-phosphate isomerase